MQALGVKRVVLGRELSLNEIAKIRKNTTVGLEVFIHGGMCSSFSGRCMLSNHMVNRDANRGGCAHSCRWNYDMYDSSNNKLNKDACPSPGLICTPDSAFVKPVLPDNLAAGKASNFE